MPRKRSAIGARGVHVRRVDGAILGDVIAEADHFTGRRDVDAELFLLQRPEPAMRPGPEADVALQDLVRFLQAEGAFEKDARLVVGVEGGAVLHAARVDELLGENAVGEFLRRAAVVPKLDRRLGERGAEPVDDDEDRDGGDREARGDEEPVGACELFAVHWLSSVAADTRCL